MLDSCMRLRVEPLTNLAQWRTERGLKRRVAEHPSSKRSGGREINKMPRSTSDGADGVVRHDETLRMLPTLPITP